MTVQLDKVSEIKQLVADGQYRVDPHATAEALMRRIGLWPFDLPSPAAPRRRAAGDVAAERQRECSYPDRFRLLSRNSTPVGPSITEPIRVRPAFAASEV